MDKIEIEAVRALLSSTNNAIEVLEDNFCYSTSAGLATAVDLVLTKVFPFSITTGSAVRFKSGAQVLVGELTGWTDRYHLDIETQAHCYDVHPGDVVEELDWEDIP